MTKREGNRIKNVVIQPIPPNDPVQLPLVNHLNHSRLILINGSMNYTENGDKFFKYVH